MPVPAPVFTPMTTYSPMVQGHHVKPRGPMGRPMPMMKPGVFRGKEISRNVDDYEQQCENAKINALNLSVLDVEKNSKKSIILL